MSVGGGRLAFVWEGRRAEDGKGGEALEEALCFGWIDGQMQSIDEKSYKKYFSLRRENSKWSEKNDWFAVCSWAKSEAYAWMFSSKSRNGRLFVL